MERPVIFPELKGQHYDCEQCGQGCRELVVYLTERDRQKIDEQDWKERLGVPPYIRFGHSYVLNHTVGEECVFLTPDSKCRIHAEYGYMEKPLSCQMFPFSLEPEGRSLRVTVRFDCPAVAKGVGSALSKHRPDVMRLAKALQRENLPELAPSKTPVELVVGRPMSEKELDRFVAHLEAWLGDGERSILQRMIGLESLLGTLSAAKLERLDEEQLLDLIDMLIGELPRVAVETTGENWGPPPARQGKLFRLSVFAHCESLRLGQACGGLVTRWKYKLDQLRRARRLASGVGGMPGLVIGFGGGTFEQLAETRPDAELKAGDADRLLTRYLRARVIGRTFCGPGYYGWPAVDGLRALMQAVAIVGWVTRYLAVGAGRGTFGLADIVRAVGIVDRHATRSPELGTRTARMRLHYLVEDRGLLRLLRNYSLSRDEHR